MKTLMPNNRGFTLIELLVTVSLIAILIGVAAPSFTAFQRNAELTSFANSMIATINSARGEAIKRGRYAMVVPVDTANWSSGWTVFVDVDRSQTYDATSSDILVSSREAPPTYLTITPNGSALASPPYILFDASGYTKMKDGSPSNLSFSIARNDVSPSIVSLETRVVKLTKTGRVRVCKPSNDSTCTMAAGSD